MDYKLVSCPVCKKQFEENDDIVVCPECGTPHHRACYASLSHCANESLHSEGFVFEVPRAVETETDPVLAELEQPLKMNDDSGEKKEDFRAPFMGGFAQVGVDLGEHPQLDGIPLEEVSEYVGRDPSSARLLFNLVLIDRLKRLRPNFAAFLFPYIWLFYRKMYKAGAIFIALTLLITVAFTNKNTVQYSKSTVDLYFSFVRGEISADEFTAATNEIAEKGTGNSYYYDAAGQVLSLVLRLVVALFANKWYLQKMKRQILETREECSSMDEYMAALRVKGGKSVASAIVSVAVFAVLTLGVQMLLYAIYL